jgi:hypothetical protein
VHGAEKLPIARLIPGLIVGSLYSHVAHHRWPFGRSAVTKRVVITSSLVTAPLFNASRLCPALNDSHAAA